MPYRDTAVAFIQGAGPAPAKVAVAGMAVLGSALWDAFTSLAVALLALFIVADVLLGIARAVSEGGIQAFDETRFYRAGVKLVAALVIIAVTVGMDLLVHSTGRVPEDWAPAFASGVAILCAAYLASIAQNATWFFPELGGLFDRLLSREQPRNRREGDDASP